jgi:hypothetical protein
MAPPLDGRLHSKDKIALAGPIDDLNSRRSWSRKKPRLPKSTRPVNSLVLGAAVINTHTCSFVIGPAVIKHTHTPADRGHGLVTHAICR